MIKHQNGPKRPPILAKFHKLMQLKKPLYIEAFKIMAAITEVIKQKAGSETPDFSAVSYYACLNDMILNSGNANLEAIMYAYSAIISMLELGVISHQADKITNISKQALLS